MTKQEKKDGAFRMNARQAIAYIESTGWSKTRLGLSRERTLLAALGDPQKGMKFIHVAGSNGKGSTCAMLARILRAAGYRTGLYISPYIQDFCERIQIDGKNIPRRRLAELASRVRAVAEGMEDHPSQFELVTALAFDYFREEACDVVVLEVGMGGEHDATNAIDAPELAILTNIGLEHTEYLGNTLEAIAQTKSGIIKSGCDALCYDGAPEVSAVVRRVCRKKGVSFTGVDFSRLAAISADLSGQRILWDGRPYRLALTGTHQLHNAATVLTAVEILRRRGWEIPDEAVRTGLARVKWPARFELLAKDPVFILDGGHNPQCAQAMADSLDALLPGQKVVFLAGVLADKDYGGIIDILAPHAKEFLCLTPVSDRALPAEAFASYLRGRGLKAQSCADIPEGIRQALKKAQKAGCAAVAFGSLYLAGAVRTEFRGAYRAFRAEAGGR